MPPTKAKAGESTGRFAYEGLERVFHEKARLGHHDLAGLPPRGVVFSDLKELCHLTDGNLSRHLQVLNEAGFVEIWKGFHQQPAPDPLPDHRRGPPPVPRIHQRPRDRRPGRPQGRRRARRRRAAPTSPKAGRPPERPEWADAADEPIGTPADRDAVGL